MIRKHIPWRYIWKLNQSVLELDFRAVNFLFLYTCLTSIPRFALREKVTLRLLKLFFQGVDVVEWSRALDVRVSEWCCSVSNEYWIRDHLYGTMLIEDLCCLMPFFKEEKQQQKSKPEAYLIADMFHVYTIANLYFLGWNLTNKSSSAPRLCSVHSTYHFLPMLSISSLHE
jgi:hypothetical protein